MRARIGRWRITRRRAAAEIAVPWFVIALFLAISLQRILHLMIIPTMDGCEQTIFWLGGWEERRSVMQVTGGVIAGFGAWFLVWLFEPGAWITKIVSAVVLLGWLGAYDRQLMVLLPDRPHPAAALTTRLLGEVPGFDLGAEPRQTERQVVVADLPNIEERLLRDPLAEWSLSPRPRDTLFAPEAPTQLAFPRLNREWSLRGENAPTYGQLEAVRGCLAYNAWIDTAIDAAVQDGATIYPSAEFLTDRGYIDRDQPWTVVTLVPPVELPSGER